MAYIGTSAVRDATSIADGIIVDADINASAAIAGSKIADDAITLAKMAGGTDGELITYDASGDPANVAVGTSGHVLTSGGAGVAPTFQAAAGGGKVLQVVSNTDTSVYTISTSGSSYVAYNGINTSITPVSSSNSVLIMVSLSISGDPASYPNVHLYRDSTLLIQGDAASSRNRSTFSSSAGRYNTDLQTTTFVFLDTAISTTSSVTYKLQVNCGGQSVFYVNQSDFTGTDGSTGVSSMIIQEIGA